MSDKSERTTSNPSISSAAGSHAKTSALQEKVQGSTEPDRDCGQNTRESFASIETQGGLLGSWWWKTCQRCLVGGWVEFSETWPRAGMMRSGTAYRLQPSAPITAVTEFLLLHGEYPTPQAAHSHGGIANSGDAGHLRKLVNRGMMTYSEALILSRGAVHHKNLSAWRLEDLREHTQKHGRRFSGEGYGGGQNPTWTEWLMGFPPGWTDLDVSGTP